MLTLEITHEAQVAVGDNAHQLSVAVDHRYAADVIFLHHGKRICHTAATADCHRVVNHAVLGTLHSVHLPGLLGNAHVLVDYAEATLTGYGYGQRALGHRIHRRRYQRHVQFLCCGKIGH